jgi:hypothetical protein
VSRPVMGLLYLLPFTPNFDLEGLGSAVGVVTRLLIVLELYRTDLKKKRILKYEIS